MWISRKKNLQKKIFCQETSQGLSELKVNLKHTSTYIKDKIEDAYIEERTKSKSFQNYKENRQNSNSLLFLKKG